MLAADRQLASVRAMGKPNLRLRVASLQIAGGGDDGGPAGAHAGYGGDGRNRAALQPVEHLLHARLVAEAVLGGAEVAE